MVVFFLAKKERVLYHKCGDNMKNFKIVLEYDGSKYNGWQKQGNTKNTIEYKFLEILKKMTGKQAEIFASGRTDSGVHAKGQVANFKIETDMSDGEVLLYINTYLPEDIRVLSCVEADERFHSRLNAKKKTYMYRICLGKPSVFERKYVYATDKALDVEKMKEAAKHFTGRHDFKAFCTKQKMKKSTIREIYSLDVVQKGEEIDIIVCGNGFLYNMVRIISGTLFKVGTGEFSPEYVKKIIEEKNRENAGDTLPPNGLVLLSVEY